MDEGGYEGGLPHGFCTCVASAAPVADAGAGCATRIEDSDDGTVEDCIVDPVGGNCATPAGIEAEPVVRKDERDEGPIGDGPA